MKLDEVNYSKAWFRHKLKAAGSETPKVSKKTGLPRLNVDGSAMMKTKPLTKQYGERRALRGTPTASSHQKTKNATLGPIIGSGGPMHDPISPSDAANELSIAFGKMRTGQILPFSQLPDQSDSHAAVVMRNKRSAPGRAATWENGAKWDKDSQRYGMDRMVLAPDGTKITKNSKPRSKSKPARSPSGMVADPDKIRRFKRREKAQTNRKKLSRGRAPRAKKSYKKPMSSGKIYNSRTIDENFSKSLNRALGL